MKYINYIFVILFFVSPYQAYAVMQSLDGLTAQNQTFVDDTNVTITPSGTTHTLGWNGLLSPVRGGTGVNLSSFTTGSLLFWNGSAVASDNLILTESGDLDIGNNNLFTGGVIRVNSGVQLFNAGSLTFYSDLGMTHIGEIGVSEAGIYRFTNPGVSDGVLNFSGITDDRSFTIPDTSGTFGLLEANQTFTGLNKFEASNNSTIYVGSSTKSGCIALGDSDGSGVTYITANDGVLSASTTPPANCN